MRLMIFGAGFSGKAIARELAGHAEWIGGTTRSAAKFDSLRDAGIEPFLFEPAGLSEPLRAALASVTHLVQSIAPDEGGDPLLAACGGELRTVFPALRWVGYLSTVGVYGDHDGAWVDETTPCRPVSERSVLRLAAEEAWTKAADRVGFPLAILRLSGIYGPGRNVFVNYEKGTARRLVKPGQVFNRIHVADIAGAAFFLMQKERSGTWNVTDDEPAPPQDLVTLAAELMAVEPPPEIDFETAELTPMARSFYGENKRVANLKLKDAGYGFRFPNYRLALADLWKSGIWRG